MKRILSISIVLISLIVSSSGYAQPAQVTNPVPANMATGVAVNVVMSWTGNAESWWYNIYFGATNPPPYVDFQAGTEYSPTGLQPNTTYYWKINPGNGDGETQGELWQFTTVANEPPDQAANPFPEDGATEVSPRATMTWSAAAGAATYDVYFGEWSPPAFIGSQTDTFYRRANDLEMNLTYYWRVDTRNGAGTVEGVEWQFTTQTTYEQPTNPFPENGAVDVPLDVILSWSSVPGAYWYDILFGTTNPPPYIGFQGDTTLDQGALPPNTTFYWKVNPGGGAPSVAGELWTFTTTGGGTPPAPAINPVPAHQAVNVPIATESLSWDAAEGADYYEIHIGTSGQTPIIDTVFTPAYPLGALAYNTTYYWRVHSINEYGNTRGSDWEFATEADNPADELTFFPTAVTLGAPYPNPFNAETTIPFVLSSAQHITLTIYDMTGREVAKLADGEYPAGKYNVKWNSNTTASGVYLVKMKAGNKTHVVKMLALK